MPETANTLTQNASELTNKARVTQDEHETVLNFDYSGKVVRIYTTRDGVKQGIVRRLGNVEGLTVSGSSRNWFLTIPMEYCRGAHMICKLLNPDEKQPMPEGLFSRGTEDESED